MNSGFHHCKLIENLFNLFDLLLSLSFIDNKTHECCLRINSYTTLIKAALNFYKNTAK